VTARALWLSSSELALADIIYSLADIRYPKIVQQAQGRSAKTVVSPHRNNQSTIYNLQSHPTLLSISKNRTYGPVKTL
jgi:hypothetical protein